MITIEQVKEVCKENDTSFPISGFDITSLVRDLDMGFDYDERNNGDADYWNQVEYYSNKIKKTIIFDYDAEDDFDTVDDFVLWVNETKKGIEAFEESLTALK